MRNTTISNNSKQSNYNKKGGKKPFVKKEKFNPLTYKIYLNGTRGDIENNILEYIVPAFKALGVECFSGMEETLDEMAAKMFGLYQENIPEMIPGGKNSYWSLTFASNRISLKTDKGYQFGWVIQYNKGRTDYDKVEFFFTAYSPVALPSHEDIEWETYWTVED